MTGKHLRLDIETLGTKPGCIVLEVGLILFDPEQEMIKGSAQINICPLDSARVGLRDEVDTVEWWRQQGRVIDMLDYVRSSSVADACVEVSELSEAWAVTHFWANSPSFDMAILDHLFDLVGEETPWNHRNQYDMRTLCNLTGVNYRDYFESKEHHHHAVEDARAQAFATMRALRCIDPIEAPQ